ncbi:MAG: hypothetical protein M1828_005694 [Chrysothrix sp. TS-e1954]|nr:MAG: hypothetical protein M1828_005694 [Chrysothrix sp. TS-e1954]
MDLARVIRGTLTIIKDADALYKQLKEVPEGLIAATRRINIIRSQLEYFERTLQDLDSCFVKTPSIHYVIEGDVAPLKHALYEFKAILSGLLMDGVVLMSRAHYALLGLRTLQKTQRVFTSIERDFEYLGNFVNTKSINDQPNSALYNTEILKQIRLKQRAEEEARKDESAQWSLLHLQIQDALNKVQNASCRKNTWEVEDLLGRVKLEMKKIGLATSVVESICANAANVLQIGHFKVLSSSKVQQTNVAGVYPQSKLLQTETLTADSPLSPTLQRSLNTSTWQILCTGRFNSHGYGPPIALADGYIIVLILHGSIPNQTTLQRSKQR